MREQHARKNHRVAGRASGFPLTAPLPPEVRYLLAHDLGTMEHVEVLLRLHGDEARAWTVSDLVALVASTASSVTSRLDDLVASGLASRDAATGTFQFTPRTPEMRRAVESLEEMYRTRPVTLVKAIYEKPASAVQSFADAFRVRKSDS